MTNENKIRKAIRKYLFESLDGESEYSNMMGEEMSELSEERIPNEEARKFVEDKENFIGSHIFGERVENFYVVCSYNESFPLFIFDNKEKIWYENNDKYIFEGEPVEQTEEHRIQLKPTVNTHLKSLEWMLDKLNSIKKKAGISELSHTSVQPGTKN